MRYRGDMFSLQILLFQLSTESILGRSSTLWVHNIPQTALKPLQISNYRLLMYFHDLEFYEFLVVIDVFDI
eukprot:snap_masked-scaffold_39-processed-gene-2.54-mRNA-1 protein AED:1.00 eAED:1.00 QI:0/0/0/0/1/1/2/0/70